MKKRFCLIGIISALIVAGVALASCSNLIEDLKEKILVILSKSMAEPMTARLN